MLQLDAHIDAQVNQRILGDYAATRKQPFDPYDPDGSSTRNASFAFADVDMTGWSPGLDNELRPIHDNGSILITPRHVLTAEHLIKNPPGRLFGNEVGDKCYFFDSTGATVLSTPITAIARNVAKRSAIMRFDEDLPSSIKRHKILGSDYASYITPLGRPVIRCSGKGNFPWFSGEAISFTSSSQATAIEPPAGTPWQEYYELLSSGGSGHPVFFVIDGEAVLLGTNDTPTVLTWAPNLIDEINALIVETDDSTSATGYTVTEYDLAAAAASIQNSGYHGLLGWLMGWLNVGSPRPTDPGLEFTIPENRMHFTMPENRCHFTVRNNRCHFAIPEED